jgi:hypothetical protein
MIKQVSDNACPAFGWVSSSLATFIRFSGPEDLGGFGDLAAKITAAVETQPDKTLAQVADSVWKQTSGNVIKLPGMPDLYDYEFFPQEVCDLF